MLGIINVTNSVVLIRIRADSVGPFQQVRQHQQRAGVDERRAEFKELKDFSIRNVLASNVDASAAGWISCYIQTLCRRGAAQWKRCATGSSLGFRW